MGKPFKNLGRNHKPSAREIWRLMTTKRPKWVSRELAEPADTVVERVQGEAMRLTFINHMTFLIQTHGKNLLTDPIWAYRCSPSQQMGPRRFAQPGLALEDLPPIDGILISHDHYDHLCLPTLRRLAQRGQPTVFVGTGVGRTVRKSGLRNVVELEWWQDYEWEDGWRIHGCPAQHFSGRTPFDRNQTLWLSLWLQTPSASVYFAGDTGMGPHFELIRERLGAPDLSLIPIGAYKPEWFMSPVHMSPQEALQSHDILGSKHSIATHFGTFALAMDEQDQPPREILETRGDRRFDVMRHGQAMDVFKGS